MLGIKTWLYLSTHNRKRENSLARNIQLTYMRNSGLLNPAGLRT